MNLIRNRRPFAAIIAALVAVPAHGDELIGNVIDLGSGKGLMGVVISIEDIKGKEVASGVTDGEGAYRITVAEGKPFPFSGKFQKPNYVDSPARLTIYQTKKAQVQVGMIKREGPPPEYYNHAAEELAKNINTEQRWQELRTIASLPDSSRQLVSAKLNTSGHADIVDDLTMARQTQDVVAAFSKTIGEGGGFPHVAVLPDDAGKIVIVPDSASSGQIAKVQSALDDAKFKADDQSNNISILKQKALQGGVVRMQ